MIHVNKCILHEKNFHVTQALRTESFIQMCTCLKQDVVVHAYNPSTQETDTGGWQIQGQPGLS
jgi:hypothetical protein